MYEPVHPAEIKMQQNLKMLRAHKNRGCSTDLGIGKCKDVNANGTVYVDLGTLGIKEFNLRDVRWI
jgi:hypothetical protein